MMAAEFHRKTATLFEEFKKRELHFLNTEVNLNSNVNWKNEINAPLQEYLLKINKREQENEMTYKNLMRQMEELGKRTDQMTVKLEKLNALRNVALNSDISAWPTTEDTYNGSFQSYYNNTLFQTIPKVLISSTPTDFPPRIQPDTSFSHNLFQHSASNPSCHSVSTQTEYIFCDNCHFPLILNTEMPVSNLIHPSRTSNKTIIKENEHNLSHKPPVFQENLDFSRRTVVEMENLIPKSNYSLCDAQITNHNDSMFLNERISSGIAESGLQQQESIKEHLQQKVPENYVDNAVARELTNEPVQKRITEGNINQVITDEPTNMPVQKRTPETYIDNVITDESTNVPIQKRMSESYIDNAVTGDFITHSEEKQYVEIQDSDLLSNDGNFEQTISKSDDESMQHEFNFLESDKSRISKNQPQISESTNQMSDDTNYRLPENATHTNRFDHYQIEANYITQSHANQSLQVQQISADGKKTEGSSSKDLFYSTGSVSPSARSENASVISESDSFSEKDTPLTATAAYQALLGNVSVTKPKQRSVPISDTDTEDEIENALANAVRRTSHIAFDTAVLDSKAGKKKESVPDTKREKTSKPLDTVSTKRPQNKLSKKTKKVLGLDTSSGSDVELEVKNPTSKIEEESDEFDFYG